MYMCLHTLTLVHWWLSASVLPQKHTVNIILLSLMCKLSNPISQQIQCVQHTALSDHSQQLLTVGLGMLSSKKTSPAPSFPTPTPTPYYPFLKLVSESWCSGTPVAQQDCANREHTPFCHSQGKSHIFFFPQASSIWTQHLPTIKTCLSISWPNGAIQ